MQWLVNAIFKAIASYVALWLEKKKAERLELKLKKMEIAKEVEAAEANIKEAAVNRAPDRHLNPAMWNRGTRVKSQSMFASKLVILVVIFCCGCATKFAEGTWPIIIAPLRPQISETPDFNDREQAIVDYSGQLEDVIDQYNIEANKHNSKPGVE